MADKISTIILKVDLDCHRCYKKITKTVSKLQERVNIQTIAFDEKNNTVTISGPFDPQKVAKKLCCKAGNVIKDLQIKENKEKPKDTKPAEPAAEPKKDKPKETKPAEPKKDKPKETTKQDDKPAEPKKDKPKDDKPAEPKKDKPKETKQDEPSKEKDKPKDPGPKKDKPAPGPDKPDLVVQPVWTGPACGCGCRPWYEGYYGDNRCCWCGRGYGCMPEVPPAVVYGAPAYGGGYKTCTTFFCEEDPQSSCNIM